MNTDLRSYQIGGDHYKKDIQPWDVIACYRLDFWEGNALKYLLRRKPGADRTEDLRKARHYLDYLIERETGAALMASFHAATDDSGHDR